MTVSNRIAVRPARSEDAARIAEISVASWREAYGGIIPQTALARLSADRRIAQYSPRRLGRASGLFVAECPDHGIVGFGSCGTSRVGAHRRIGEFYEIYVLEAYQRRGIGRRLMAMMAARLQSLALEPAIVWVLRDNGPARRFYSRLGGRPCEEKPLIFDGLTLPGVSYSYAELDDLTGIASMPAPLLPTAPKN